MFFRGQGGEASSSHKEPNAHPVSRPFPFTFVHAHVPTRKSSLECASPFLKLPAELRNKIYELVAKDQEHVRISAKGRIILPPLGRVCKATHVEMRGLFEAEVISNVALPIEACVLNFNFDPLFNWLDNNDLRPCDDGESARLLTMYVTCRPELPGSPLARIEDRSQGRSIAFAREYLPQLLYTNRVTTLKGWKDDENTPRPARTLRRPVYFHSLSTRSTTGRQYHIGIIADSTWRTQDLDHKTSAPLLSKDFYNAICFTPTRTYSDWMLAVRVGQACQSDCSRSARDDIAASNDERLTRLVQHIAASNDERSTRLVQRVLTGQTYQSSFWKWTIHLMAVACDQANRDLASWGGFKDGGLAYRMCKRMLLHVDCGQIGGLNKRAPVDVVRQSKRAKPNHRGFWFDRDRGEKEEHALEEELYLVMRQLSNMSLAED